jgi:colanic acid biosynthesis glycosyl transferase WcaI
MKILIVSQWCYPEPDARILNMAEELQKAGHTVEILTGFPNYPGGKIYKGYRLRLFQREVLHGVRLSRVWLYPSHDKSSIKRILNYASFAIFATLIGPFIVRKPEIIYVYHPPATAAIPAIFLKLIYRAGLVYDIQDLWPDSISETGMIKNNTLISLINKFQHFIYNQSDAITVISNGFKNKLISRGLLASKIHVIYNWSIPNGRTSIRSMSYLLEIMEAPKALRQFYWVLNVFKEKG